MGEWKNITLKNIVDSANTGLDAIKRAPIVLENTGKKCLRIQDISQSKSFDNWGYTSVDQKNFEKFRLKRGDIIIARTGNTIGVNRYIEQDFASVYNNGLIRLRVNTDAALPKYVFYNLRTKYFNDFIESISGGTSTQPNMQIEVLLTLDLLLPPLPEQQAIAEVLSSLDDKIDLLHRNNKTLEQMAETITKEFIIIENKQGIKLKDYVLSANTGLDAIKRAPIVEKETDIKCLRIQDISQEKPFIKWGNTEVEEGNFKKFQLKKHDIIMARTCTPGINFIAREDLPAVFNNGLVRIRANAEKTHPIFLYYLFKSRDFIGHIDGISGGTSVQLNMQVGDLLDFDVSLADNKTQEKYLPLILELDNKISNNIKQLDKLKQTRDTLLPKLMSGQVRVELK